ncbi:hypothetical protein RR46_10046 [Papilio xuthus]|uniref:Uncharacterized protein n=1 Tax=Papilio xuthus TaxID=66420 RepID=A0A194Q0A2_PAPXU|nr:hypothetical protein RR46_10046 [Papilio xuthus]
MDWQEKAQDRQHWRSLVSETKTHFGSMRQRSGGAINSSLRNNEMTTFYLETRIIACQMAGAIKIAPTQSAREQRMAAPFTARAGADCSTNCWAVRQK